MHFERKCFFNNIVEDKFNTIYNKNIYTYCILYFYLRDDFLNLLLSRSSIFNIINVEPVLQGIL